MEIGRLASVKYEYYPSLENPEKEEKLIKRIGDGSIITRFDRTPLPRDPTDVVCPHFLELKWAYGCPFDCAWCYLKGTFRFLPKKTCPGFKDRDKIKQHVLTLFHETSFNGYEKKEVLNTGELADSLMQENNGDSFSEFIIGLFEQQRKHRVLFLTKTTNIRNLLNMEHNGTPITSFTLNAFNVSKRWEHKAPPSKSRIEAARKLSEAGYEVRIRIDPMVPVKNRRKHYLKLVDTLFKKFVPERITIGSLRGLQSTINNVTDKSWVPYLSERSNWGRKIDFKTRFDMYSTIINHLRKQYNYSRVALCKETVEMWDKLRMDYRKIRCNCI